MKTAVLWTLTVNRWMAVEPPVPVAVTVMVATPAATGVTVTWEPDTLTVAMRRADADAA